ncbi:hypothetical protein SISSUDRAFT_917714 [Sistotremastrum suecicum HHB10207 ss-3]|uniref:Uncharacterized protein n=1 Tax=Sistotremastrum suecicum HHB10207 ss-3 TaxID=1314776 RepID=A0A166BY29_9AGAM|nr:hypothetical protein SISSUDRAFT_917714 [Sistotremastrum suecicum HHB10207 ss-3]
MIRQAPKVSTSFLCSRSLCLILDAVDGDGVFHGSEDLTPVMLPRVGTFQSASGEASSPGRLEGHIHTGIGPHRYRASQVLDGMPTDIAAMPGNVLLLESHLQTHIMSRTTIVMQLHVIGEA